jgi:hypothetical protein
MMTNDECGTACAQAHIEPARAVEIEGTAFQAAERRRGGWNTTIVRRIGRRAPILMKTIDGPVMFQTVFGAGQAQESSTSSRAAVGTEGAAGSPEHNAPEHGAGGNAGSDPVRPETPPIKGSTSAASCLGLVRERTVCEQPARAAAGARKTHTNSDNAAKAGGSAHRLLTKDLDVSGTAAAVSSAF